MSAENPHSSLPDWVRAALEAPVDSPAAPTIRDQRAGEAWPLFVQAATVSSFLPRELDAGELSGPDRKNAEKAVLSYAELSSEPGGARWILTRDARREILSSCAPSDLAAVVALTAPPEKDPVTDALREFLSGKGAMQLEALDIGSLEAMRLAATWLDGVPSIPTPSIEELDRAVELRRLLAPFERMTGKTTGEEDRFFGRSEQMETLREYVGVVAADRVSQRLKRVVKAARRKLFTGRKPLNVWGAGGVGKTTLIAKFMLEHSQAASARFPFAYLDFDRSTVSVSSRAGLLAEMCRQVGAQFSDLTAPMQGIRERCALAVRSMPTPDSDYISVLLPFFQDFRKTIDDHFDSNSPFLLVFDTFEVVQYGTDQVASLEEVVRAFNLQGEDWQRLRVIVSGRSRQEQFCGKTEELELGALDLEGSAQMLRALAGDAGKIVSVDEATRLVKAIAKEMRDPTGDGVRPLRLRIIGELFAKEKESGPVIVKSLLEELSKPSAEQRTLGAFLVDGILVRRILEHIRDPRVRALADPGLVVRRVTKDVIRDVMTRGTSKNALAETSPKDEESIEPWIVDDAEAQTIFEAFTKELTLIDREGDLLKHRQDVRREMLPLIRTCRPHGFARVHRLAFDFFRGEVSKNPKDDRARAEAVYHGLWLNEPLEELDKLWPESLDPGIDPQEFDEGSLAAIYLRARRGHPVTAEEVQRLPHAIALQWLSARSEELLSSLRVVQEVPVLRAVGGDDYAAFVARPDVAATAARVLYRAGSWREAMLLLRKVVSPQMSLKTDAEVSLLRTYATIAAKSDAPEQELEWALELSDLMSPAIARAEVLAHLRVGLAKGEPVTDAPTDSRWRALFSAIPAVQWRKEARVLRLVIASGVEVPPMMLQTFVSITSALPRDQAVAEILSALMEQTVQLNEVDEVWESFRSRFLREQSPAIPPALRALAAADHSDWLIPFGNALTRDFPAMRKDILRTIRDVVSKERYSETLSVAERGDGHSLLQMIVAQGALTKFAQALATLANPAPYPETAPEIAAALVRWHERTTPRDPGPELKYEVMAT